MQTFDVHLITVERIFCFISLSWEFLCSIIQANLDSIFLQMCRMQHAYHMTCPGPIYMYKTLSQNQTIWVVPCHTCKNNTCCMRE